MGNEHNSSWVFAWAIPTMQARAIFGAEPGIFESQPVRFPITFGILGGIKEQKLVKGTRLGRLRGGSRGQVKNLDGALWRRRWGFGAIGTARIGHETKEGDRCY
jgi:hypothetical protein